MHTIPIDQLRIEPLEDWIEANRPPEMEHWEWHKFLCSIARLYLVTSSAALKAPMPELLRFLTATEPGEWDS